MRTMMTFIKVQESQVSKARNRGLTGFLDFWLLVICLFLYLCLSNCICVVSFLKKSAALLSCNETIVMMMTFVNRASGDITRQYLRNTPGKI